VGFTGGMNVTDVQTAEVVGKDAWRDTHLRLTGTAVRVLQRVFADDWYYVTGDLLDSGEAHFPPPSGADCQHIRQGLASRADPELSPIHSAFFTAINTASKRLYVTTPYFIPDEAILTALAIAAKRGVDTRLLIPRRGDVTLVDMAARSYLPELL